MDFMIGGIVGLAGTFFTNPIDVVKIRLQLQGELQAKTDTKKKYRNTLHAMYVIAKSEGLWALQKGLITALVFGFFFNAIRLNIYHVAEVQGWTKKKNGKTNLYKAIWWSGFGGYCAGTVCNPVLMIKTRLQAMSHPSIAVGRQYNYEGMFDGLMKMYKAGGVRGFISGSPASGVRLAIGSAAQLTSFSKAKDMLVTSGLCCSSPFALAFVSSCISGMVIVLVVCPLDVATTRMYNQGTHKGEILYKGTIDCLGKIYKTEGLHGLYKGLGPLYLRLAPQTTISLVMWDLLNILLQRNKKR